MLGLRLGEQAALTFAGERTRASTLANPSLLDVPAPRGAEARGMEKVNQVEPTGIAALDFIQRTGNETQTLARRLKEAVRDVKPAVEYPPFALCQSLRLVAQMIAAEAPTRVYYVTLGGFDTHSAQLNRHAALLAGAEPGAEPLPPRPEGARATGPRAAADLLGVRPAGDGEQAARHRPRHGQRHVPAGRQGQARACMAGRRT